MARYCVWFVCVCVCVSEREREICLCVVCVHVYVCYAPPRYSPGLLDLTSVYLDEKYALKYYNKERVARYWACFVRKSERDHPTAKPDPPPVFSRPVWFYIRLFGRKVRRQVLQQRMRRSLLSMFREKEREITLQPSLTPPPVFTRPARFDIRLFGRRVRSQVLFPKKRVICYWLCLVRERERERSPYSQAWPPPRIHQACLISHPFIRTASTLTSTISKKTRYLLSSMFSERERERSPYSQVYPPPVFRPAWFHFGLFGRRVRTQVLLGPSRLGGVQATRSLAQPLGADMYNICMHTCMHAYIYIYIYIYI